MVALGSRFNRFLLALMLALYLFSLGAFTYANWKVDSEHVAWSIIVNTIILSLPLVLFYGSAYVLILSWQQHRLTGQLSPRLAKVIHWAPRIAAIVIIFFISLFSLDVFEMEGTPLELLGGFLIHSLPSIVLILLLLIAWRKPLVGVITFLLAGVFFLRFVIFDFNPGHFLLFSGPFLLISGLFYADWRWNRSNPPASGSISV